MKQRNRRSPMLKSTLLTLFLTFTLLLTGCQHSSSSPGQVPPATETTQPTETGTVPATEETIPNIGQYQSIQWLTGLTAEEVDFVEFVNLSDADLPYRRYEGSDIQEVIDLFQARECLEYMPMHPVFEYAPIVQWPGYYSKEFHVVMKDGSAHTVCSVYSTVTVIDGTGFHTISDWLNNHWPESGNAPLPENWPEETSTRNYHIAEDTTSTLSTQFQEDSRFHLDQSYDTDIAFGSLSRHYPIGRGGIELSASGANTAGITINADWSGTGGLTRLHVQPQYWLEQWQEDAGCYLPLDGGYFTSDTPEQLIANASRSWYISWEDTVPYLQPGYYRVGMTFYEEYNGQTRNETVCYAKFTVSEAS